MHLLSDFEVEVVARSPLLRTAIGRAERALAGRVPAPVSLCWMSPGRIRHNRPRNLYLGRTLPTIAMYELKAGSQLLYGELDLTANPIDPSTLPAEEGIRLLANRMMEVVETWAGGGGRLALAYSAAKLILACGDAVLLLDGLYHYSYAERGRRLARRCATGRPPWLDPAFMGLYSKALALKLSPSGADDPEEIVAHWALLRETSRAALGALCGACALPGGREPGAATATYAGGVLPVSGRPGEDLIALVKCWRAGKQVRHWARAAGRRLSLVQSLYAAIPPLFYGLSLQGPGDERWLAQASRYLDWALYPGEPPLEQRERALVSAARTMWHLIA